MSLRYICKNLPPADTPKPCFTETDAVLPCFAAIVRLGGDKVGQNHKKKPPAIRRWTAKPQKTK